MSPTGTGATELFPGASWGKSYKHSSGIQVFTSELGEALRAQEKLQAISSATRGEAKSTPLAVVEYLGVQFSIPNLERLYPRLGTTRGPLSTAEARAGAVQEFAMYGRSAGRWLLAKMATERGMDELAGATEALIALGPTAVRDALQQVSSAGPDGQRAILRALAYMPLTGFEPKAVRVAAEALDSTDIDLREAAYELLIAVGTPEAQQKLRERKDTEKVPDLRDLITEALTSR